MIRSGDVLSYIEMCQEEGVNLQRGMNFRLRGKLSVILMSLRPGAPYEDRVEDDGKVLIYEGHDVPNTFGSPDPKTLDQPLVNPGGSLTANGLFHEAALRYKLHGSVPELVKVYEKIRNGIWVYNGLFMLVDAWQEMNRSRKVIKFRLELVGEELTPRAGLVNLEHSRVIPTSVKLEVWKRDRACCVTCGSVDNLHFDHIIPYSKGGTSLSAQNIQLLCARHNLAKKDRIE